MPQISLADELIDALRIELRPASLRRISKEAGVAYEWLCDFKDGQINDPGIRKVEAVRDALERLRQKLAA